MTLRFFFSVICFLLVAKLGAQIKVLNKKLEIHTARILRDYYHSGQDARGLLFQWTYSLKPTGKQQMISTPLQLVIRGEGGVAYRDTSQLIVLRCNVQQRAEIFVPYRLLELRGGENYASGSIKTELNLPNILNWQTDTLSFEQPLRCRIELELINAMVKEQFEAYDPSELAENNLPDPYWGLFLGRSSRPVAVSPTLSNSFSIESANLAITALQSDSIWLRFFDEDGRNDKILAQIALPACIGDASFRHFGQMQQDIKGLTYTVHYQQLTQQPIMLFARKTEHKGLQGVRIDVDYNVSRSFRDQAGKINFVFLTENREIVELSSIEPIAAQENSELSPPLDSFCALNTRARWSYFVPFYAWNNEIKQIAFYMLTPKGQKATATPCILLNSIAFEQPLRFAALKFEENHLLDGMKGVAIRFDYEIIANYPNIEALYFAIRQPNGAAIPYIYKLNGNNTTAVQLPPAVSSPYGLALQLSGQENPMNLGFFVPYAGLNEGKIQLLAQLQAAQPLQLLADTVLNFKLPPPSNEVAINIVRAGDFAVQGDYGRVVQVAYKVPKYLRGKCQINFAAYKEGQDFARFRIGSCDSCRQRFSLPQDTGAVEIILPYRYLAANDSIQLRAWVSLSQNQKHSLSDTLNYRGQLLADIATQSYSLKAAKIQLDEANKNDSLINNSLTSNSSLSLWVGTQCLIRQPLKDGKYKLADLNEFSSQFTAHRQDRISVILIDKNGKELELYRATLTELRKQKWRISAAKSPFKKLNFYLYSATARSPIQRLLYRFGLFQPKWD